MSPHPEISLTHYSGREAGTGLSDLTTGPEIRLAVDRADGVIIDDPLSFPWEYFVDDPPRCPVIVNLSTCTASDIVALVPALGCLTASDRLLGDHALIADVSHQLGLVDLWTAPDTDLAEYIEAARWSKRADVEERAITRRLAEDSQLQVIVLDGDTIRGARNGFAQVVLNLSAKLGGAVIDTVWGIHPYPGQPLDRAVLAFRSVESR